jgi:L-threonylcarbamoyladenylate synthase
MGTRRRRVSVKQGRSKLLKWDDSRMEIISKPTQDEIKKAAKALKDGHLVAFPTETVYGLGADATNAKAVSRIYSVKGRPTDHPLIVHISSINQLDKWAIEIPEYAIKLARDFWPGPMTLILKRSDLAKDFITGGQDYIGLRVPNQPEALALLSEFESLDGLGIAAPSANRFGAVSPTSSNAVDEELGQFLNNEDLILDGGQCVIGIESTIIDCTKGLPSVLRPGTVTTKMIGKTINLNTRLNYDKIKASGLLKSHYSPQAKVFLDSQAGHGDGFLALASIPTPEGAIRLASPVTSEQYAHELYSALRLADNLKLNKVIAKLPNDGDLSDAIKDRLSKAAT